MLSKFATIALVAGLTVTTTNSAHAVPFYTVTDLGIGTATAVNDLGVVAGYTYFDGSPRPFYFDSAGQHFIPNLSASLDYGVVTGINNSGDIVGYSQVNSILGRPVFHPFIYSQGSLVDLGSSLGNNTSAYAYDINNNGIVVGIFQNATVFTTNQQSFASLGIPNNRNSPLSINDSNHITGSFRPYANYSGTLSQISHAFLYDDTGFLDIGLIAGMWENSYGTDINDHGVTVGYSRTADDSIFYPFIFNETGFHVIDTPASNDARVYAINNSDDVVGAEVLVSNGIGKSAAFLFQDSAIWNLNDLIPSNSGWDLLSANDINNTGQIVGYGYLNGVGHAFLLTPISEQNGVPAPQTITLMLAGLGLLSFVRARSTKCHIHA